MYMCVTCYINMHVNCMCLHPVDSPLLLSVFHVCVCFVVHVLTIHGACLPCSHSTGLYSDVQTGRAWYGSPQETC